MEPPTDRTPRGVLALALTMAWLTASAFSALGVAALVSGLRPPPTCDPGVFICLDLREFFVKLGSVSLGIGSLAAVGAAALSFRHAWGQWAFAAALVPGLLGGLVVLASPSGHAFGLAVVVLCMGAAAATLRPALRPRLRPPRARTED